MDNGLAHDVTQQDVDLEQFGILLTETARVWRSRLDAKLRPLGLSQAKWVALFQIDRGGEGMSQKTLAERLAIEGPTMVGLLDRLAKDGWIERRTAIKDRRSKEVHLTEQARQALSAITQAAREMRGELLVDIPREDLVRCMQVLALVRQRAETQYMEDRNDR
jgi:MarR family transcriptional regulator for hemolysin